MASRRRSFRCWRLAVDQREAVEPAHRRLDAALAVLEPDVAFLAPLIGPAVLAQPRLLALAEADDAHRVDAELVAGDVAVDAARVSEEILVGDEHRRDGSLLGQPGARVVRRGHLRLAGDLRDDRLPAGL